MFLLLIHLGNKIARQRAGFPDIPSLLPLLDLLLTTASATRCRSSKMVSRVSPFVNPFSPAPRRWGGGAAKAAAGLAATALLIGLLVVNKSGGDDAAGILMQRATRAMSGAQSLVTWSNEADDGRGVLHGTQHGITQSIESCDADDPACNFQVAADGDPQKGVWKTNRPPPVQTLLMPLAPLSLLCPLCVAITSSDSKLKEHAASALTNPDQDTAPTKRPC